MVVLNAVYVAHAGPDSVAKALHMANKGFIATWGEKLTRADVEPCV